MKKEHPAWTNEGRIVGLLEALIPGVIIFILLFIYLPTLGIILLLLLAILFSFPYFITSKNRGKQIEPTTIKVGHLVHPHEWDGGIWSKIHCYDYPDTWLALNRSRFNPGINIEVETPDIDEVTKKGLTRYDIIFITGHSLKEPWTLSEEQNEKLTYYLEEGGAIWIDQCGEDGGPNAPNLIIKNFPVPFEFKRVFPWSHLLGRQRIAKPHPILDGSLCFEIKYPSLLGLYRFPWTGEVLLEDLDSRYDVLVEDMRGHPTIIVAEGIGEGKGRVLITSYDFSCSIHAWYDFLGVKYDPQDLMFAYNVLLWAGVRDKEVK